MGGLVDDALTNALKAETQVRKVTIAKNHARLKEIEASFDQMSDQDLKEIAKQRFPELPPPEDLREDPILRKEVARCMMAQEAGTGDPDASVH